MAILVNNNGELIMKRIILFIILFLLPLIILSTQAHSGGTDSNGGHCRGGKASDGSCPSGDYHKHGEDNGDGDFMVIVFIIIIVIIYAIFYALNTCGKCSKQLVNGKCPRCKTKRYQTTKPTGSYIKNKPKGLFLYETQLKNQIYSQLGIPLKQQSKNCGGCGSLWKSNDKFCMDCGISRKN